MSYIKQKMVEDERRHNVAKDIAVEVEVLQRCDIDEECVFQDKNDIEEAYKLANSQFSNGELEGIFDDRRQMTDKIKEVVEESPDECSRCAYRETQD